MDELCFLFNITKMVPMGQFYLRASNDMKFTIPGANVKYAVPWKEEWLVVEGEWGHTAFIRVCEYPVLTQFTTRDKWAKRVLSPESRDILGRIMKRGYTNMKYLTLDLFEGDQLERYLRISLALPGKQFHLFLLSICTYVLLVLFLIKFSFSMQYPLPR